MLVEQFKQIQNSFNEFGSVSYSLEKFKELPFEVDSFHKGLSGLQNILAMFIKRTTTLKHNIGANYYQQGLNTNPGMIDIANEYLSKKPEKFINIAIDNYFNQFTVFSDALNIDIKPYQDQIHSLKADIANQLSFVKKYSEFCQDYDILDDYINNETPNSLDQKDFIDELEHLFIQYDSIVSKEALDEALNFYTALDSDFPNSLKEKLQSIVEQLKADIKLNDFSALSNLSDIFVRQMQQQVGGDISHFLVGKKFEDSIATRVTLNDNQKIQEYIVFKDDSVAFKKHGEYNTVDDNDHLRSIFMELKESIINFDLRKRPKIAKFFLDAYKEHPTYFAPVILTINNFMENEQILKNMKFDFKLMADSSWEAIDDHITFLVKEHKLRQYSSSILSNKNKHFLTDWALDSFRILIEADIPKSTVQELIGKKLAAIKTPAEFQAYMDKVVDHFSGFNYDNLCHKLEASNITPVYNLNNEVVVFEVKSFEDSKKLGSPSWCISREEFYFNDYTSDNGKQYFLYDFSKSEKDVESMIGFTVQHNGTLRTQHLKDDDYFAPTDFLFNIVYNILYQNMKDYQIPPERVEILKQKLKNKIKLI